MNSEMAELRRLLDLFEGAGFAVTYFLHYDASKRFNIAIKSTVIKDIALDYDKEPARAGDIVALIEKNNYRLIKFKAGLGVPGEYAGTIYLEIVSEDKTIKEEALLEH